MSPKFVPCHGAATPFHKVLAFRHSALGDTCNAASSLLWLAGGAAATWPLAVRLRFIDGRGPLMGRELLTQMVRSQPSLSITKGEPFNLEFEKRSRLTVSLT